MRNALLVEDNVDNCDLVVAFLENLYHITIFNDGRSALSYIQKASTFPDIFLFDISLPEIDGVDLLKKMRREKNVPYIPALALTSHAMKGDKEHFLSQGFDGYISKPIDDELLISLMDEVINNEN